MEIEAKPKITKDYVRGQLQCVISAAKTPKMNDAEWKQFLESAERMFMDDMQNAVEIAFNKGREYERRNGSQP